MLILRRVYAAAATVLAAAVVLVLAIVAVGVVSQVMADRRQADLQPFYDAPDPLPDAPPGTLLRHEPLRVDGDELGGASAHRILYLTEGADGAPRIASGRLFIPDGPAPAGGRPVVSWAHPTTGMGTACAPSRTKNPIALMDWLPAMLQRGWVVVATDYAGLGTEGIESYLIARSEVPDVVNAVRATQNFPGADASTTYAVFGHSQGGHASLWAGTLAPAYAPELNLVGVAGAAPAAPLADLVGELWDTELGWLIGAEVAVSFPANYPGLDPAEVLSRAALGSYERLARRCLGLGGAESAIRQGLGQRFFDRNPLEDPDWAAAIGEQSAPPVRASIPVLVTQSVNDGVIAPASIARMTEAWCEAGSVINTVWLGPLRGSPDATSILTHVYEGAIGGAIATTWLEGRFAGEPAPSSCGQTAPLLPGLSR